MGRNLSFFLARGKSRSRASLLMPLHFADAFCCFAVSPTNSNPHIDPVLRLTIADTQYVGTGDKSISSPIQITVRDGGHPARIGLKGRPVLPVGGLLAENSER